MVLGKLVFLCKSHIGHIASGARFSSNALAKIIYNDEMKTRPLILLDRPRTVSRKDPVKYFDELEDAYFDACFFEQLARYALLQGFSKLERPSRDGPLAAKRFAAPADQQRAAVINDDAADADDGTLRIFAGGSHFRKFALERFTIEAAAPRIRVDLGQRGI
jgi:hypothetical protein